MNLAQPINNLKLKQIKNKYKKHLTKQIPYVIINVQIGARNE